jgi:hypothetical protein
MSSLLSNNGTVEFISDRQTKTIAAALKRVIGIYKQQGFRVATIEADPEFRPLEAEVRNMEFNLCAQNEHVPDIERYIRTVKDRVRSCYHTLPYSCIPRVMIIRLVYNAVFWLNAFPHNNGVSNNLAP